MSLDEVVYNLLDIAGEMYAKQGLISDILLWTSWYDIHDSATHKILHELAMFKHDLSNAVRDY